MLQGCIITGHHTRKPQTQDTLAGFTPAGRPPCPPFPPSSVLSLPFSSSFLSLPPTGTSLRYSNVLASWPELIYALLLRRHSPFSGSHTLPSSSPSLTRAAVTVGRCVRLRVGHPQHQQHKRVGAGAGFTSARIGRRGSRFRAKVVGFFIFFSSMSVCVYGYWLPFSRRYWPCHCRPPLILPIDLLRSSTPSIADPCVFVCVCVCVCCKWAGTCNLIRFEMRKRRCQQARLCSIVTF